MEPLDDEREVINLRFRVPKNAPETPIPFHGDIADAIEIAALIGGPVVLALLLKMILRDRITDDEVQLICDVFYHE